MKLIDKQSFSKTELTSDIDVGEVGLDGADTGVLNTTPVLVLSVSDRVEGQRSYRQGAGTLRVHYRYTTCRASCEGIS